MTRADRIKALHAAAKERILVLDGAYAESVVAGIVNTQPAARARLEAFADKTGARVRPES